MKPNRKHLLTLLAVCLLAPAPAAFAKKDKKPEHHAQAKAAEAKAEAGKDGEGKGECPRKDKDCGKKDGDSCCGMHGGMGKTAAIIRHQVKDYEAWRKEFDAADEVREKGGVLGYRVLQNPSDPKDVTVIGRFADEEAAKKFTSSPDLKAAMEKSGVTGEPQVTILNDVTGGKTCDREDGKCGKCGRKECDGKECPRKDGEKKECHGKKGDSDELKDAAKELKDGKKKD